MDFTWIDWIIIAVLLYFATRGWTQGIWYLAANLVSFFLSLALALKLEPFVAPLLIRLLGISSVWAAVIAYVTIAFLSEALFSSFITHYLTKLPKHVTEGELSQVLGAVLSALNGVMLITFFLVLLMTLPLRGTIKQDIKNSVIGPRLLYLADTYGGNIRTAIETSAEELTQFLTVKPESGERVPLDAEVTENELSIDEKSEREMLILVNNERATAGVSPLVMDERMRVTARAYSRTMLLGRYFSHIDAQGHDAAYRLQQTGVQFMLAGENLAYAPSLSVAHKGLMNSEGHRHNILDPRFHRVGIGVIDAGIWGKMFTQVFAD